MGQLNAPPPVTEEPEKNPASAPMAEAFKASKGKEKIMEAKLNELWGGMVDKYQGKLDNLDEKESGGKVVSEAKEELQAVIDAKPELVKDLAEGGKVTVQPFLSKKWKESDANKGTTTYDFYVERKDGKILVGYDTRGSAAQAAVGPPP